MEYIFLLTAAVVAGIFLAARATEKSELKQMLTEVSSRLQIPISETSFFGTPELHGSADGHFVSIFKKDFSHGKSSVSTLAIEIEVYDSSLPQFSISAEGFLSGVSRFFGENDFQTGDEDFDAAMLIKTSDPNRILTVLSPSARGLIEECMGYSYDKKFTVNNEKIAQYIRLGDLGSVDDILYHLERLQMLADLLKRKGPLTELLAENYMQEPVSDTRKRILEALDFLKARFAIDSSLIKKALSEDNKILRFYGARLLEGDTSALLEKIYKEGTDDVKTHVIKYYQDRKDNRFWRFLIAEASLVSIEVKKAMADYFGSIQCIETEPYLILELKKSLAGDNLDADTEYMQHLINALASCGTLQTVEFLYSIKTFSLKRDAEQAIAAIQARVGTGEAGWLSMPQADDDAGKLSLLDGEEQKVE